MARYRKVEPKMWRDEKFRQLTPIQPGGQALWVWFLTGPCTTNIPGVLLGTDQVMAAELRWPLKAFQEAFAEASVKAMAKGDFNAGLVWLPNACRPGEDRNKPESPNVVRSWRDTWDELPDCRLKLQIWQSLGCFTEGLGDAFAKAFREACRQPSPNQDQEQNQEQNQEQIDISSNPENVLVGLATETRAKKSGGKKKPNGHEPDPRFVDFQAAYPPRAGDQGWPLAAKRCRKLVADGGVSWDELIAGATRYAAYVRATDAANTQYVKSACVFVGPEKYFLKSWAPPRSKAQRRQDENVSVTEQWLAKQEADDAKR